MNHSIFVYSVIILTMCCFSVAKIKQPKPKCILLTGSAEDDAYWIKRKEIPKKVVHQIFEEAYFLRTDFKFLCATERRPTSGGFAYAVEFYNDDFICTAVADILPGGGVTAFVAEEQPRYDI